VRIALLALTILLVGCGGSSPSQPAVKAEDFDFSRASLTIKPGETVVWTNTGTTEHTVKGPGFFSKAIEPGAKFSHRFDAAGTFRYICTLHPEAMRATVVVKG
jgi:plastocyanin